MFQPIILPWDTDASFFLAMIPFLQEKKVKIQGVLHIGAHQCEEKEEYNTVGILDENILWIEGNKDLCEQNKKKGIQNIYNALISDSEKEVIFNITNNYASSSIFPLHMHKYLYPNINVIEERKEKTMSLSTFFKENSIDYNKYNMWVLDIQGADYEALVGGKEFLKNVDVLFCEVNFTPMYENIELADSVKQFLEKNDFVLTHVKNWQNCWGDALFLKKKFVLV
jgi:FkbM family methyltransferase